MPGLSWYSKKVADKYPWTQAVPDDPHSVYTPNTPPNYAQNTPNTSYLRTPNRFLKFGNYALYTLYIVHSSNTLKILLGDLK